MEKQANKLIMIDEWCWCWSRRSFLLKRTFLVLMFVSFTGCIFIYHRVANMDGRVMLLSTLFSSLMNDETFEERRIDSRHQRLLIERLQENIQHEDDFVDKETKIILDKLADVAFNNSKIKQHLMNLKKQSKERMKFIKANLDILNRNLAASDANANYLKRKAAEIRARIEYLQNRESSCPYDSLVVYKSKFKSGYACQLHGIISALIYAYNTNRTLIITDTDFPGEKSFETYFAPISRTCGEFQPSFEYRPLSSKIVNATIRNSRWPPDNKDETFSKTKAEIREISKYHLEPTVWYIGQFASYVLRFNELMHKVTDSSKVKLNLTKPYAGIHVRRGDKSSEALFFDLKEYMKYVDEYFDQYYITVTANNESERRNFTRTVYLATDELTVLRECRLRYPNYNFVFDESYFKWSSFANSFTVEGMTGILLDIYYLANADFVVCTFSSNVCRLLYELTQSKTNDYILNKQIRTLDTQYFIVWDLVYDKKIAIMNNYISNKSNYDDDDAYDDEKILMQHLSTSEQLELIIGDLIQTTVITGLNYHGYQLNGLMRGKNLRTGLVGYFPSYKVVNYYL